MHSLLISRKAKTQLKYDDNAILKLKFNIGISSISALYHYFDCIENVEIESAKMRKSFEIKHKAQNHMSSNFFSLKFCIVFIPFTIV